MSFKQKSAHPFPTPLYLHMYVCVYGLQDVPLQCSGDVDFQTSTNTLEAYWRVPEELVAFTPDVNWAIEVVDNTGGMYSFLYFIFSTLSVVKVLCWAYMYSDISGNI